MYGKLVKPNIANSFRVVVEPYMVAQINGFEIDARDTYLYESVWDYIQENPLSSGTKIEENVLGKNSRVRDALQWLVANEFLSKSQKGTGSYYRTQRRLSTAIEWRPRGESF
jgi:hypothetical protein